MLCNARWRHFRGRRPARSVRSSGAAATSSGSTSRLIAGSVSMMRLTTSVFRYPVHAGLVRDLLLDQRRADIGRADGVRRHTTVAALECDRFGQALQSALGRDVRRFERRCPEAVDRGDIHDPAELLFIHMWQRGAHQPEWRFEHQREQQPELLLRRVLDRGDVLNARVVHDDVGRPASAAASKDGSARSTTAASPPTDEATCLARASSRSATTTVAPAARTAPRMPRRFRWPRR